MLLIVHLFKVSKFANIFQFFMPKISCITASKKDIPPSIR